MLKTIPEPLRLAVCLFPMAVMKATAPAKRATVSSINAKSHTAFLRQLPVCICSYRISVLRYKFLIFDAYNPALHIHVSEDMTIRGYFSKRGGVREKNILGNTDLNHVANTVRSAQ